MNYINPFQGKVEALFKHNSSWDDVSINLYTMNDIYFRSFIFVSTLEIHQEFVNMKWQSYGMHKVLYKGMRVEESALYLLKFKWDNLRSTAHKKFNERYKNFERNCGLLW